MSLPNVITSNTAISQSDIENYSWPITISGDSIVITFTSSLVFSYVDASQYFILAGPNITVDGCGNTVEIDGVENYPGLIQNGDIDYETSSITNGYLNTVIQNIGVISSNGSTLGANAGWIGQQFYAFNASDNVIQNCYSTGEIGGFQSGGIVGYYASSGGNLSIDNCYTTGAISGYQSGGIVGSTSSASSGYVSVSNCYSTGVITGDNQISGGFSSGAAGGIFGSAAGYSYGTAIATNCYSLGGISGESSGGIFGQYPGVVNGNVFATNCYVVGNPDNAIDGCGNYVSGIFGSTPNYYAQLNCFVENGTFIWNSVNALNTLTGLGTIWNITEIPYTLYVFYVAPPTPTPSLPDPSINEPIPLCNNKNRKFACMNMIQYNKLKTGGNDPKTSKKMNYSNYVKNFSKSRTVPVDVCTSVALNPFYMNSNNKYVPHVCTNPIFSKNWKPKTGIHNCNCPGI